MNVELSAVSGWVSSLYWPLVRVAGMVMVAPIFSSNYTPMRIRVGLCVLITMVIVPGVDAVPSVPALSAEGILITATQVLIGVAMGFMVRLVFNAVVMGGESIAMTMGLGYALMNDPSNGVSVPIVSQFYSLFVTLLFLAFNGHHALIELVDASFNYLPVGEPVTVAMLWRVLEWSLVLFTGAVMVAVPALCAMLTVNLIMGVMTRAAPQLNILSVGFPVTMMVGFIVIMLTLPVVAGTFQELISKSMGSIADWLRMR
jgi:flagellar biosynthetic protein FliR